MTSVYNTFRDIHCILTGFANGVSSSRLRLTPSRFPRLNLVEVYHNGQWGTVLPNPFVPISPVGQVICRQLGYNNLTTATSAALLRSSRFDANLNEKIWLIVKTCDGTESDINACTLLPWGTAITDHRYDLLVRCSSCKYHNVKINICVALLVIETLYTRIKSLKASKKVETPIKKS